MITKVKTVLKNGSVRSSAPCRIDMGGTLDMSTFYYPLGYLEPCTFNIAIRLRTHVTITPHRSGFVKVSSKGFDSAEFQVRSAPFDHPLGLIFAIAAYFNADGVHIDISSESPPRSALGGSSVAAVAIVAAFLKISNPEMAPPDLQKKSAAIAFYIESSIAGGTCGMQDHLAAAFGGVNAWYFEKSHIAPSYRKVCVVENSDFSLLEERLVVAYCGIPHMSENVNGKWIKQFLSGKTRHAWIEIVQCTQKFITAIENGSYEDAYPLMNRETEIRREMTPDVLDDIGNKLVDSGVMLNCGVRFTGAGGGGCVWAMGEREQLDQLKSTWHQILSNSDDAVILVSEIDPQGVIVD